MAELKRDRVNRRYPVGNQRGAVVLPIDCPVEPGEEIELTQVVERDIFFEGPNVSPSQNTRDPNQMYDPHMGNGIGDAIFDAGVGQRWLDVEGDHGEPWHAINSCDAGEGLGT